MTTTTNHPWAKYYASRGVDRPQLAQLVRRRSPAPARASESAAPQASPLARELAAAVAAATAAVESGAASSSSTSFFTATQKEAVAREVTRTQHVRLARLAVIGALGAVLLHVAVTQVFHRAPTRVAVQTHADQLKADLLPLYSNPRQPLQIDNVAVAAPERLEGDRLRYVAHVTLRLRQPMYVPASSNGTVAYRQLQVSLQAARDQELRYNLFSDADAPDVPTLPVLLQSSHRAGETVIVKVPFIARRFGWSWKLEAPQTALRQASRSFDGDSIEFYSSAAYLIYSPQTLADVRAKVRAAHAYVSAVTNEVHRRSGGRAIEEPVPSVATEVARESGVQDRPAIDPDAPATVDPDAPAVELPAAAATVARAAWSPAPAKR